MKSQGLRYIEDVWLSLSEKGRDETGSGGNAQRSPVPFRFGRGSDPDISARARFQRALVACTLIALSTLLRWTLGPLLPIPIPFTFYLPAIVAVTIFFGHRWGYACIVASVFLAVFLWTSPTLSLRVAKVDELFDVLAWSAVAVFIVAVVAALQRAIAAQRELSDQLRARSKELSENAVALEKSEAKLLQYSVKLEGLVAERTEKLTETIMELESFSYAISHNLRSPLRAIQGFTQLVVAESGSQLTESARDYLGRVEVAARRMDELVKDLAMFNRAEGSEADQEQIEIAALVDELVRQHPEWRASGGSIQTEALHCSVYGNRTALMQAFAEVIGNAFKFVEPGVAPSVRVSAEPGEQSTCVRVADNGIGIPASYIPRLFTPLSRGSAPIYAGRGLGLAIAKKLFLQSGARIALESSSPGQTVMKIEFPRRA